jgi:hypothetical protein
MTPRAVPLRTPHAEHATIAATPLLIIISTGRALMNVSKLSLAAALAAMAAIPACKTMESDGDSGALADSTTPAGTRCRPFVAPELQAAFAASHDAFKELILGDATTPRCLPANNPRPDTFTFLEKLLTDAQCSVNRIYVSETAIARDKPVSGRIVDRWTCNVQDPPEIVPQLANVPRISELDHIIWIADVVADGSRQPSDGFEIIAWDRLNQVHTFYTAHRGPLGNADFAFSGTSFQMAPMQVAARGYAPSHPCLRCHPNGAMNMKELVNPWMNWTPQGRPQSKDEAGVRAMAKFGAERQLFPASDLEFAVRASATAVANERVRRVKAGPPDSLFDILSTGAKKELTLRDLLRPLFCETEINLAMNSRDMPLPTDINQALPILPALMASQDLVDIMGKGISVSTNAAAWRKVFEARRPRVPARSDLAPGQVPERTMLMPMRAATDTAWVKALADGGILEENVAAAALMVDFQNSMFSAPRCGLAALVPDAGMDAFRTAPGQVDAQKITQALKDAMTAAGTAPAKQLVENLGKSVDDMAERYLAYADRCKDKNNAKRIAAPENAGDLYDLIESRNRLIAAAEKAPEPFRSPIVRGGQRLTAQNLVHAENYAIERALEVQNIFPDAGGPPSQGSRALALRLSEETCGLEH